MRWVVAAVVVLVLLAVGWVGLSTLDSGDVEVAEPETVTVRVTVTETSSPEPAPEPEEDDAVGLPEPVAEKRAALLEAADAGDHERLAALAGDEFSYSFGGPVEGGPAAFWRGEEEAGGRPLEALAAILRLPYAIGGGFYVWPFAHAAEPGLLTDYERSLLADIPGGAPVDEAGYRGWRAGIAPDGEWQFFIAGD